MWPISGPDVIEAITSAVRDEAIFIADGHHRYESALAYRDELRAGGALRA